jgi:sigma-B regulation protein RsbU (phosphoserine phosphatase)
MPEKEPVRQAYKKANQFTQQVLTDLRESELPQTIGRDLKDTYAFYLDEETRDKLAGKGHVGRSIFSFLYLLRSLFLKLAPTRRLILLLGVAVTMMGIPEEEIQIVFGMLMIMFVLGLELKDKLIATDELAEGRSVQIALMPTRCPDIDGWETFLFTMPANDVGGDLVDHLQVVPDKLSLSLGDVAGKGLPAALMMAKLQATIRAISPLSESLSELGTRLNQIVCRDGLPSRFASLIHLEITANSGLVRLLNAGHLPPLIVRRDRVDEMDRGSPAIGLSRKMIFSEQQVELEEGDLMIIYSDGLSEARNTVGRFYTEERLIEFAPELRGLSADSAGDVLVDSVRRFVHGARPHDDLSIILVRRTADNTL